MLFAYAVLESYHSSMPTRSVFGLFNVPAKLYPWILLMVLQFMIPNISFMGHLSGILVGSMCVLGWMSVLLPSYEYCQGVVEGIGFLARIKNCSNFHPTPSRSMTSSEYASTTRGSYVDQVLGGLRVITDGTLVVLTYLWYGVSAVLYVFGCPVDAFVARVTAVWQRAKDAVRALGTMVASSVQRLGSVFTWSAPESRAAADSLGTFQRVSTAEQMEI